MLDLTKYDGHTQYDWILVDLRTLDGDARREEISICFQAGADAVGVTGGTIARIRNVISRLPLNDEDAANARLIVDAPKLLAEVVRQRAEIAALVAALRRAVLPLAHASEQWPDYTTAYKFVDAALSKHGGA